MSEEIELIEENTVSQPGWRKGIDTSMIIALVALVISLVGTITGIYEARIMREQQSIMQAQKGAGVWPYVQRIIYVNYNEEDNTVELIHLLKNNGIGPAILGDVDYRYGDKSVETYSVHRAIKDRFPELTVSSTQNQQVDQLVLAAGQSVRVFTVTLAPKESIFESPYDFNEIADAYSSHFCYCSVFGECWRYGEEDLPVEEADCDNLLNR
ncbi:hypothetical protein CEQ90_17070 [Lewinellaceae bacterium SD302]|nr:hypothetical protein CEQ90_17070 [Lewinellaceae bacterium SD302]